MDGWTSPARPRTTRGSRGRTSTTGPAAAASGSRRARSSRPPDTVYMGFGLEGITGRRGATRSWAGRSTTCCPDTLLDTSRRRSHSAAGWRVHTRASGLDPETLHHGLLASGRVVWGRVTRSSRGVCSHASCFPVPKAPKSQSGGHRDHRPRRGACGAAALPRCRRPSSGRVPHGGRARHREDGPLEGGRGAGAGADLRVLTAIPATAETRLSFAALADLLGPVLADVLPNLPRAAAARARGRVAARGRAWAAAGSPRGRIRIPRARLGRSLAEGRSSSRLTTSSGSTALRRSWSNSPFAAYATSPSSSSSR